MSVDGTQQCERGGALAQWFRIQSLVIGCVNHIDFSAIRGIQELIKFLFILFTYLCKNSSLSLNNMLDNFCQQFFLLIKFIYENKRAPECRKTIVSSSRHNKFLPEWETVSLVAVKKVKVSFKKGFQGLRRCNFQCCGIKYIVLWSGSWSFARFGSGCVAII